jgi:hypothetical protein
MLDLRVQCNKTFFVRKLQFFVISQNVRHWQAFPVLYNEHSSLVRKSVNHRQKMFYNIEPRSHFEVGDEVGTKKQVWGCPSVACIINILRL